MIGIWLRGVITRRSGRLIGVAIGVAMTVALLASLGSFITNSAATMTNRAIAGVPVDWQVLLAQGASSDAIANAIRTTTSATTIETVGYADVAGFNATVNGTVQTTGAGKVLGLSPHYAQQFPDELRSLIGTLDGVLVAQQTASNLHVTVGDSVTIQGTGLPPVDVQVVGIVDLPQADSLFQAVGAPIGLAPQAPPDNVLLLPSDQWHRLFDAQAQARPDLVRTQLHVRIGHNLPSDPNAAFIAVQQQARNVEAQVAGSATVGNNLAARLDGARSDASYAGIVFLFLGLPGACLAIALTLTVASAGETRRRQESALLRVRGATSAQIVQVASVEGLAAGVGGVISGLIIALVVAWLLNIGGSLFTNSLWAVGVCLVGMLLAWAACVLPIWRDIRMTTVTAARSTIRREVTPVWQRFYPDILLLCIAGLLFWRTASTSYQLVLAPEGVLQTAISYDAFLAPLCLWLGAALLIARLWRFVLLHGQRLLTTLLRPLTRNLAETATASIGRQSGLHSRGVVVVALTLAFATSTAIFNTTYGAQARVDAELTNGADVQVRGSTAAPAASKLADLAALPDVAAAVPMQHRFAYVGSDLQDLFGIDTRTIGTATNLANAYFANHDAQATLAILATTPDGVLVSEETMTDFQLKLGDTINVRLQRADDQHYHVIPFHFIGVVREFPTAPKDSFLVANAAYIAQQTGISAAEVVLLRTVTDPITVAEHARALVGGLPGVAVTDIGTTQRTISSSLTAVDLRGLTALELSFAIVLILGTTGLTLAVRLVERQRTFAILAALGARPQQIGSFVWSEGVLLLIGGVLFGTLAGFTLAQMLVSLLTHVFDPPPEVLHLPWTYLCLVLVAVITSVVGAVVVTIHMAQRHVIQQIRGI